MNAAVYAGLSIAAVGVLLKSRRDASMQSQVATPETIAEMEAEGVEPAIRQLGAYAVIPGTRTGPAAPPPLSAAVAPDAVVARFQRNLNFVLAYSTAPNGAKIYPPIRVDGLLDRATFVAFRSVCRLVAATWSSWACVSPFDGYPLAAAWRAPVPDPSWYHDEASFVGAMTTGAPVEWLIRLANAPDGRNRRYQLDSLTAIWHRVASGRCRVNLE